MHRFKQRLPSKLDCTEEEGSRCKKLHLDVSNIGTPGSNHLQITHNASASVSYLENSTPITNFKPRNIQVDLDNIDHEDENNTKTG